MSTAGKVLIGLIVATVPLWVVLASGVAELNKSGGEQVQKLQAEFATLEKNLAETRRQVAEMKDQIATGQVALADQLAVLRSRQADLQKIRSETIEIATRVKYQLEDVLES